MPTLYGNTTGLSPLATKALERVYRRKVGIEHIATPELIKSSRRGFPRDRPPSRRPCASLG